MTRIIDVSGDPNLLYEGEIDGSVMCTVQRTTHACILELWNGDEKIYSYTHLPHEGSIAVWEHVATTFYDKWKAQQ